MTYDFTYKEKLIIMYLEKEDDDWNFLSSFIFPRILKQYSPVIWALGSWYFMVTFEN